jgi:hypothetical protein
MDQTTPRLGYWIVLIAGIAGILYEIAALAELAGFIQPPMSLAYILAPLSRNNRVPERCDLYSKVFQREH